ncbi:MAG: hypothetical protein OSB62_07745 [Alphaproteobacteria bacterium]|nr:hypothetical protein [Alphaproteobacteria bacterium]
MDDAIKSYLKSEGVSPEVYNSLDAYIIVDHGKGPKLEIWNVEGVKKPTAAQIKEHVALAEAEIAADAYKYSRKEAYQGIGEQLDAILKGFNTLRMNGTNLPEDLDSVIQHWLNVKKEHPKP